MPEVLFDLAEDPDETRNLAADARYAGRIGELRELIRSARYPESVPGDAERA